MTTSLLHHAFCVRSNAILRTEYREGSVYADLQKKRYVCRCAACQYPGVTLEDCAEVKVRTLPIGRRTVFLVLHLHRLRCRRCSQLKLEPRNIAAPRKSWYFPTRNRQIPSAVEKRGAWGS